MAVPIQLTIDCADPARLARFWAAALEYEAERPPRTAIIDPTGAGPRIFFQKVPEAKRVKNRLHIDVHVSGGRGFPLAERRARVEAAAARLARSGATRVEAFDDQADDDYWVVMRDPEGNEFCVI